MNNNNEMRKIMKQLINWMVYLQLTLTSCASMNNMNKPILSNNNEGYFLEVKDKHRLFVYDYQPIENYNATIFIISGITGINHTSEKDIIEQLSNNENRVVVIHPRGTGYSDGIRGDMVCFADFISDYIEIIVKDKDYNSKQHLLLLYGHSMSTAVLLAVADKMTNVGGAILVNPPYLLKNAKGMSPSFGEYLKYAWYFLFEKHKPIVNMAGDPTRIENDEDRRESESRINDQLLVKYFSMYIMNESKKLMSSMIDYCQQTKYPLLLIYGMNDNIVDIRGCDMIYKEWHYGNKQYALIENGSHGKATTKLAKETINKWIKKLTL
jgi:alpha-beta hydrolase superfamily lysophospholipase